MSFLTCFQFVFIRNRDIQTGRIKTTVITRTGIGLERNDFYKESKRTVVQGHPNEELNYKKKYLQYNICVPHDDHSFCIIAKIISASPTGK